MPVVSITVPEGDDFILRLVELLKQAIEMDLPAPRPTLEAVPSWQPLLPLTPSREPATPVYNQHKEYAIKHPATDLLLARHREAIAAASLKVVHIGMVRAVLDALAVRYGMDEFRITAQSLAEELGYTRGPVESSLRVLHKVGILKHTSNRAIRRIDWMA